MANQVKTKIAKLRKERDRLWAEWNKLQKRSSFSGLHISGKLNEVQQELDELGDKSKRYYTEINMLG